MTASDHSVIVIGASYSGIPITHKLLRTLPSSYRVILIDPSTHLYWNMASPRAVTRNHMFSKHNKGLFSATGPGFAKYTPSRFTFIQGRATQLSPESQVLTVTRLNDEGVSSGIENLSYTHVIICTGGSLPANSLPFTPVGSHVQTQRALEAVQIQIEAARTIVVSGAGPTGVETAGELATLWPDKRILLVSAGKAPLPRLREDVGLKAQQLLESLGVEVRNNVKVVDAKEGDKEGLLRLSDGTIIEADLHLPTHGLIPNTSFVPAELKSENGSVLVTPQLRSPTYHNVWVTGDAADLKWKGVVATGTMAMVLVANVLAVANGKEPAEVYDDKVQPQMVPVGGNFAMGTGQWGSWRVWGILVWLFKGRDFFVSIVKNVAEGEITVSRKKV